MSTQGQISIFNKSQSKILKDIDRAYSYYLNNPDTYPSMMAEFLKISLITARARTADLKREGKLIETGWITTHRGREATWQAEVDPKNWPIRAHLVKKEAVTRLVNRINREFAEYKHHIIEKLRESKGAGID